MAIRRIDDIEESRRIEKREKFKDEITDDINDVIDNVFKRPKKKKGLFYFIIQFLKLIAGLLIFMIFINFVLGNVWLLKFLVKDLFLK